MWKFYSRGQQQTLTRARLRNYFETVQLRTARVQRDPNADCYVAGN